MKIDKKARIRKIYDLLDAVIRNVMADEGLCYFDAARRVGDVLYEIQRHS